MTRIRVGVWVGVSPFLTAVAIAAVGNLLTASASWSSANFDPWGTNTPATGAHPDGSSHSYCFQPMDSGAKENVRNAENFALDDRTDARVVFHRECDYVGGSETDVSWDTVSLPGTTRGKAYCEDFDNGKCDQFYAELDLAELRKGPHDGGDITKTACHELGHTVGLTHHSSGYGCMISGEMPNANVSWRRYVAHHRAHINAWF